SKGRATFAATSIHLTASALGREVSSENRAGSALRIIVEEEIQMGSRDGRARETRAVAGNPFNDRPTVGLLEEGGALLGHVSQREASRLLRRGLAELVLAVPPAVRLVIATAQYEALAADGAGEKAQFLQARRGALYGNFHFQGPSGETMFHGDAEKALWYLNRGLVEVVSLDPPVLRFTFAPGGQGHAGDAYHVTGTATPSAVWGARE